MDLNAILNKAIQNLQEDDMMDAGIDASLAAVQKNPEHLSTVVVNPETVAAAKAVADGAKQAAQDAGEAIVTAGEGGAKVLNNVQPYSDITPMQKAAIKFGQAQDWAKANPALAAGIPAALLAGAGALALRRRQMAAKGK